MTRDSLSKVIAAIKGGNTCEEINRKKLAKHTDGSIGLSTTGYHYQLRKLGLKASKPKSPVISETSDIPEAVHLNLGNGKIARFVFDSAYVKTKEGAR